MAAVARGNRKDSVATGHGCDSTTTTNICSSDVFANGIGIARKGDMITIHTIKAGKVCVPHSAVINAGSASVFVNGIPMARRGDSADSGRITSGSSNVFAGSLIIQISTREGYTMTTETGLTLIGEL
jgi:uncharacterized Zn-binding protein involved in type VI secretion